MDQWFCLFSFHALIIALKGNLGQTFTKNSVIRGILSFGQNQSKKNITTDQVKIEITMTSMFVIFIILLSFFVA
jgi:hypothetical protein